MALLLQFFVIDKILRASEKGTGKGRAELNEIIWSRSVPMIL